MRNSVRTFRSLRVTLLGTLAACSLAIAALLGIGSWLGAGQVVAGKIDASIRSLEQTLAEARYPLTPAVLASLASLTSCELVTYDRDSQHVYSTLENVPPRLPLLRPGEFSQEAIPGYLARAISRRGVSPQDAHWVVVLYDLRQITRQKWSVASLPLITGLASTILLSLVLGVLSQRLVARLGVVQQIVQRIAAGELSITADFQEEDELGELARAVMKMTRDLQTLVKTVQHQEREQLIHRMAAGLAHQLRNSLTGARMAIDLVASGKRNLPAPSAEALAVAARELQRTEGYVQRILSLSARPEPSAPPESLAESLDPLAESLKLIADHHRVQLDWNVTALAAGALVRESATLSLAVENLVLNALQSGASKVELCGVLVADPELKLQSASAIATPSRGQWLKIIIRDNGPGPSSGASELFEPFYTTKPEGLGLGLALVKRAAAQLHGSVEWERNHDWTEFRLSIPISRLN